MIVQLGLSMGEAKPASRLRLLDSWQVKDTSAVLHVNPDLIKASSSCEKSGDMLDSELVNVYTDNFTIVVTSLLPNRTYQFSIVCYFSNTSQRLLNLPAKLSQNLTFNTAMSTSDFQPVNTLDSSPSSTLHISTSTTVVIPSVYKRKLLSDRSTTDIVLCVVFGLVALGIFIIVAYYFVRKLRRRQRLRRFLQYRQHENEPFQQMQDDIDDSPAI